MSFLSFLRAAIRNIRPSIEGDQSKLEKQICDIHAILIATHKNVSICEYEEKENKTKQKSTGIMKRSATGIRITME